MTEPELFRADASIDYSDILSMWPERVQGRLRPLGVSFFGDVFFERPSGAVEMLDVLQCEVRRVAESLPEFWSLASNPDWQSDNLMADVAWLLAERGLVPQSGQCVGFAPHPMVSGTIDFDHALIMLLDAWHAVCAALAGEAQPEP